jgi:DNA-binding PadR family transcriptional regulator
MAKKSLGEFEHQVLVTILRLGSESYTVPIVMELEERTERPISAAAVYIALRRLEKRGLVSSRLEKATAEAGGRPRRYFKLEPEALEQLKQSRRILERLWEGFGPAMKQS